MANTRGSQGLLLRKDCLQVSLGRACIRKACRFRAFIFKPTTHLQVCCQQTKCQEQPPGVLFLYTVTARRYFPMSALAPSNASKDMGGAPLPMPSPLLRVFFKRSSTLSAFLSFVTFSVKLDPCDTQMNQIGPYTLSWVRAPRAGVRARARARVLTSSMRER